MDETSSLLNAIRVGDRQAFDALVRSEGRRLYAIAWRITGDAALSEDVVQETFLRIVRGRSPFLGRGRGRAWLARVVTRVALDTLRQCDLRARREEERAMCDRGHQEPPGAALLRQEEAQILSHGFRSLPADVRAALWLHLVEGEGLREVAACLATTRSTVNRKIHAGLARLRQYLQHRGFSVAMAMPLGELLRELPAPEPPAHFLEAVAGLTASPSSPESNGQAGTLALEGAGSRRGLRPGRGGPWWPLRAWRLSAPAGLLCVSIVVGASWWWFRPEKPVEEVGPSRGVPLITARARGNRTPARPEGASAASPHRPASRFRLEGRVVDTTGKPLQGSQVRVYMDPAGLDAQDLLDRWGFVDLLAEVVAGPRPLAAARTDAGGSFVLTLEEPGKVLLHALHPAESPAACGTARLEIEEPEQAVEVVVDSGETLSGRVEAEDRPLAGARLTLIPSPGAPPDRDFTSHDLLRLLEELVPAGAVSDGEGRFEIPGLMLKEGREYLLLASRDGYCSSRVRWQPPGQGQLTVTLPRAKPMPGRIFLLPEAKGVQGARLLALVGSLEGDGWFSTAISDARGEFLFRGSTGELMRILAKLPGRLQPVEAEWRPDLDRLPVSIPVPRQGSIGGKVRLEGTGEPLPEARVVIRERGGALLSAQALTDREGSYSFEGIPLGSDFDLFVAIRGLVPRKSLRVAVGQEGKTLTQDIDLVPASSLAGRVVDPEGRPVPGAILEVVVVADNDADGVHLRWRKEILGKPQLETDPSGSFLAEDILPLGKVFLWAYHPDLGEGFGGPVNLRGNGDAARVDVQLHAAGLEVRVQDQRGLPVEGLDVELIAEVIWDSLPVGMSMIEWYRQRASMDLSYYARGMGLVPGARKSRTGGDGSCRWTDLMAGRYQVSVARIFHGRDLPDFHQDYCYYCGTLEEPLVSREVKRLEVGWVHDRRLAGRVVDPQGEAQEGLRVQVWFDFPDFPGLKRAYGYTVTHTGPDGTFETGGLGPGPYDISVWDRDDHLTRLKGVVESEGPVTITWSPARKKEGEVR